MNAEQLKLLDLTLPVSEQVPVIDANTWHDGAPPAVGWWNASTQRASDAWRYWDGQRWSRAVYWRAHNECPSNSYLDVKRVVAAVLNVHVKWRNLQPPWSNR